MHPKQICADFQSMGSPITLDGTNLRISNPKNIYSELEELVTGNKARIIAYLKGNYSDHRYKIDQTIDKIINFIDGMQQDMNEKINDWLNHDDVALEQIMHLFVLYSHNGWRHRDFVSNFEDGETAKLTEEIYERAMTYFRKGAMK